MRKMTYNQIVEELQTVLNTIKDGNYKADTCTDWITVKPGHFAFYIYCVQFDITLPCGIKIEDIRAYYPDGSYTSAPSLESLGHSSYGWDPRDKEPWYIPDDLKVYRDEEEMNEHDGLSLIKPYSDRELVRTLLIEEVSKFLEYPGGDSFRLPHEEEALIGFSDLAEKWLEETDLTMLTKYEHDCALSCSQDFIGRYLEQIALLDVLPDCIDLDWLKYYLNVFRGGRFDLSHFEEQ